MPTTTDLGPRLVLKHLLIEAGYPLSWVSKHTATVSRIYYHNVMQGVGMRKDKDGAVYYNRDRDGLLSVAREQHINGSKPQPTARPVAAICTNNKCSMQFQQHGGPCE